MGRTESWIPRTWKVWTSLGQGPCLSVGGTGLNSLSTSLISIFLPNMSCSVSQPGHLEECKAHIGSQTDLQLMELGC